MSVKCLLKILSVYLSFSFIYQPFAQCVTLLKKTITGKNGSGQGETVKQTWLTVQPARNYVSPHNNECAVSAGLTDLVPLLNVYIFIHLQ